MAGGDNALDGTTGQAEPAAAPEGAAAPGAGGDGPTSEAGAGQAAFDERHAALVYCNAIVLGLIAISD